MQSAATVWPVESVKRLGVAMCAFVLLLTGVSSAPAATEVAQRLVSVIVQGTSPEAVDSAVTSVGGRVTQSLQIVQGVSADVPASSVNSIRSMPGVLNVTPDTPIKFQGGPSNHDAKRIQKVVGSDKLWAEGTTGSGVTVAVLDTGIYAHPDLAGRVVHCEDLSTERGTAADCADTFGHGTFMAGLIAGNGASSNRKYSGVAPAANLVAIKAAGYDGSTDVTNILAGIQWAVINKATYGIRVLNLSLGMTNSIQDYRLSPLNMAVERAWQAGIVVVVSGGNTGPEAGTVMKPGDDPYVITVGASSDMGTSTINDDVVAAFSAQGPTRANGIAKPDVVSPGMHTISLRAPGSAIDSKFPNSRVDSNYFRGSGTSMSTATVSGVVAQMLQANPSLTPDQVKARLMGTARTIATTSRNAAGMGLIDAYGATKSLVNGTPQVYPPSTGLGSLEADRGTVHVGLATVVGPLTLQGEYIAMTSPDAIDETNPAGLIPWTGSNWSGSNWSASNWSGSNWSGSNWSGSNWSGSNWSNVAWDGSNWSASNWSGSNWSGSNWSASNWSGSNWSGSNWSDADWDASNWSGSNWSGSNWSASNWSGSNWSGAWYAYAWD